MNKTIDYHLNQANKLALKKIERIARTILKNKPHLDEFIMGMGSYFFTDKNGNIINTLTEYYTNMGYRYKNTFNYFKPLNNFIGKYDSELKLTGQGMRFTAKGKKITDW